VGTPEKPAWTGWHRRNRLDRWRAVCEAESEAEALDMLLALAEGGDKRVLPSGRDPNRREAARGLA
jgi:hypothetical protein